MTSAKTYIKAALLSLCLTWGVTSAHAEPADDAVRQSVVAAQPHVRVIGGMIEVENNTDDDKTITVYALTGQVIKQFVATPGTTTLELPKGYYIVKCDRTSTRVVIK